MLRRLLNGWRCGLVRVKGTDDGKSREGPRMLAQYEKPAGTHFFWHKQVESLLVMEVPSERKKHQPRGDPEIGWPPLLGCWLVLSFSAWGYGPRAVSEDRPRLPACPGVSIKSSRRDSANRDHERSKWVGCQEFDGLQWRNSGPFRTAIAVLLICQERRGRGNRPASQGLAPGRGQI